MASNTDFVQYIVDQSSDAGEISVKKMMGANSPIDFICQMTGLSEEEVLKLKSE